MNQDLKSVDVEKPLVSICCLVYNHEKFLKQTLDSFLMQQTSFPFEVVIHDDASTDSSADIIRSYEAKHPEIFKPIYQTENQKSKFKSGMNPRFNFPRAKGEFIAVCEGDDYWTDPLKLQKQVDFFNNNSDFVLCFHNVTILNSRGKKTTETSMIKNNQKEVFKTEDIIEKWFVPTCSIMFRNLDDFELPNWFFRCISGDFPFLLLLSLRGKFKYLPITMGCYRLHNTGASTKHKGYFKVYGMIFIYQSFNQFTNYKYESIVNKGIKEAINTHLPEIHELNELKKYHKNFLFTTWLKKKFRFLLRNNK
ncbi:glycosyltransferase [Tamlana sp. 62-3]|uniref:Glycosyltransferase n=1 Tax=Neotamlana sargassicola TaxID=2883125 RepID=A0A9X1I6H3_9FLAO|nr:glycosyltransferase [Tamlana sargassicola]MCB4808736.1 glycosyltransferase [Tamlana sargassicola]